MEKAVYQEQKLEKYIGNPMIEALPPIPEDDREVVRNLVGVVKKCSPEQRKMKPLLRMHLLSNIGKEFFYPFAQVRRLDSAIHIMIRSGYLNRNPVSTEFRRLLTELNELEDQNFRNEESLIITQELGTVIYGLSGSGKSRALRQCLGLYPTLIRHEEYKGKPFTWTQLPWLMVEAPYDGNRVTFCRAVFMEIDKRCGSRNLDKYGYSTHSASTMILHMQKLLILYNVGILIIDEVQNLLQAKGDSDEMLSFYVSLTNQLGVPIIYCGTSNSIKLFQTRMAIARRQTGAGDMKFQPINRNNDEWSSMMKFLWQGCVLQEDIPLESEMLDVFWECSQGLIGIVVALFCQVQIRALLCGMESFNIDLVYRTYNEDFAIVKPMLEAIKSGDIWEMAKYDDIFINLNNTINAGIKECEHKEELDEIIATKTKSITERRQNSADSIFTTIRALKLLKAVEDEKLKIIIRMVVENSPVDTDESDLLEIIISNTMQQKPPKDNNRRTRTANPTGLIKLFKQADKEHRYMYDILKEHGYIKTIEEDYSDFVG